MNSTADEYQCSLPRVLRQVANISASAYTMAMPRELMKDISNCNGFSRSLFNDDWADELLEFPALIALLCVAVILTALGIIWFVYEFSHKKTYSAENTLERLARLALSLTLLLLLLPYSFFLWIVLMSYLAVKSTNNDKKEIPNRRLSASSSETFYASMKMSSNESRAQLRKFMENFSKNLALQLESAAPKIIQKGEKSLLAKLKMKSSDLTPVLQNMQTELRSLMAYIMQLNDHGRFFYRNTTALLDLKQVVDKIYLDLVYNELKANTQRIKMLLNIENVLQKVHEIIEFSTKMNNFRQNLKSEIYKEIDMLQRNFSDIATKKDLDLEIALNKSLSELSTSIQHEATPKAEYAVDPYVNHFELVYFIVALLPFLLTVIYFERFIPCTSNQSFTRYVLMSIISVTTTFLILLCIFGIFHILYGATYSSYRREIDENADFCSVAILPHCSLHTETLSLMQQELDGNVSATIQNYTEHTLERLCGNILPYNSKSQHVSWLPELNHQTAFLDEVFKSGAMFDVVRQELYLENWYELHNIMNTNALSQQGAKEQDLLSCHLSGIKNYIFEQLFESGIAVSLLKLTQQSALLKMHLPNSNLTRLIKRVLRETQDLQDFCSILKKLLQEKTADFIKLLTQEFEEVETTFQQPPDCGGVKFDSIGISRESDVCLEDSLHAFNIGALGILILLFILLLVCICLAVLYEKSRALGVISVSSVSRLRHQRRNAILALNRLPYLNRAPRSSTVRKPTHVRFKEVPTVAGNARLKRQYLTPPNAEAKFKPPFQVRRRHATPVQQNMVHSRRKRKYGVQKYFKRKLESSMKKRLVMRK